MICCRHCHATITFDGSWWRDESDDPGDGYGGDASCPARWPPTKDGRMRPHEPDPRYGIFADVHDEAPTDMDGIRASLHQMRDELRSDV